MGRTKMQEKINDWRLWVVVQLEFAGDLPDPQSYLIAAMRDSWTLNGRRSATWSA
jgi:hypothetical protein